jgi:hypothetical protein
MSYFKRGDVIHILDPGLGNNHNRTIIADVISNTSLTVDRSVGSSHSGLTYSWGPSELVGNASLLLYNTWLYLWYVSDVSGVNEIYILSTRYETPDGSTRPILNLDRSYIYYRRLGAIKTDASGNIDRVWIYYDGMPKDGFVGEIRAWHKNQAGGTNWSKYLSYGWVLCDGSVIDIPDSIANTQNSPNLNGDSRFLRGSTSSGTYQCGSEVANDTSTGGNVIGTRYGITVLNCDFNLGHNVCFEQSTGTCAGACLNYSTIRPINMSVVYIMKVI